MRNPPTLVLVDGSSYLYRAYHAMPDLRAVPGDPASPATGAIRGMVNMMQALRKDIQADYAVCVFDASGPTFRDALYTEYKATRSPMPDDLRSQIAPIHEVVQLLGWKILAVPGVEADDVIATLAQMASQQGIQVIVSSGDKDLSQLVNEHVTIIDTMNGKRRDVAGVTAEFGVPPSQMVEYQALVGDTVDNVPGVSKVGPKTAAKWLEEHGSLDQLIAKADTIKGVAGQNLRDAIASGQLALSRQLVTMKTDCALDEYIQGLPAFDGITLGEPDAAGLAPFYEQYGFKGLARSLETKKSSTQVKVEVKVKRNFQYSNDQKECYLDILKKFIPRFSESVIFLRASRKNPINADQSDTLALSELKYPNVYHDIQHDILAIDEKLKLHFAQLQGVYHKSISFYINEIYEYLEVKRISLKNSHEIGINLIQKISLGAYCYEANSKADEVLELIDFLKADLDSLPRVSLSANDCLGIIYAYSSSLENVKNIASGRQETDIRNLYSSHLEATLPSSMSVTAESHVESGKTDILIKQGASKLLVCECKIWKGIEEIRQAFAQLRGYLDSSVQESLLLIFVKNREINQVFDKLNRLLSVDVELCSYIKDLNFEKSVRRITGKIRNSLRPDTYHGFNLLLVHFPVAAEDPVQKVNAQGGLFDQVDLETTEVAIEAQQRDVVYHTILTEADLDAWLLKLQAAELTALDTETDSLDEMQARIVGISFSVRVGEAAYVPLRHEGLDVPEQLPIDLVLAKLKPWLEDASKKKLGQHVKYDQHVLANHGIRVQGYAHDTMLQSYVLEADRPHNLGSLALRHTGRTGISYEDLCGKGKGQIPFAQVPVDKAAAYSCEDSDQTLDVHRVLWPRIEANAGLAHIYALEMQTSEALFRIERNGVRIDAPELARQSNDLGRRILALEAEAYEIAGQQFNLSSPKQLGEIFFDKLGLPVVKKTATGARSTDEEVLEKLAEDYPLPAKILEHRSLSKLKGTYTDKLAQMALPSDGRVHTHYAQAVAVTGRLSSNDPNLQNIPVRTAEGRRIREAFVAPEGKLIASADYSQIELRIMAHLSGDEALLNAFRDGLDVHRATAAEVFGVALDQVSSEQRRYAKVINFGLIYGMSSFGLAKNLGIETKAAAAYIDKYFQRYPGVKRYMDQTVELAHAQGYVETVFGRRLVLPEINGGNGPRKKAAERAAINAPMQGTAADLIKKAMVAVQAKLDADKPEVLVIMQVHDELVFELPAAEQEWLRTEIPAIMASVADLKVPLIAEIGFGPNWEKAH